MGAGGTETLVSWSFFAVMWSLPQVRRDQSVRRSSSISGGVDDDDPAMQRGGLALVQHQHAGRDARVVEQRGRQADDGLDEVARLAASPLRGMRLGLLGLMRSLRLWISALSVLGRRRPPTIIAAGLERSLHLECASFAVGVNIIGSPSNQGQTHHAKKCRLGGHGSR